MNLQCGSSDPPRARLSSAVFGIATTRKVNRHSPTRTSPCDLHRRYPDRHLRIYCSVLAAHTVTLSTYDKRYHSNCDNRRRMSSHDRHLITQPPHFAIPRTTINFAHSPHCNMSYHALLPTHPAASCLYHNESAQLPHSCPPAKS
jgi:hypothetical protein